VADIIRAAAGSFFEEHRFRLNGLHRKVLSAIVRCPTFGVFCYTSCPVDSCVSDSWATERN
jgi:hypothetical protein